MLLMCLLLVPHPPGPRPVNFDFRYDLEDLAVGSAVRAVVISGTYAYGTHRQFLRCARRCGLAALQAGRVSCCRVRGAVLRMGTANDRVGIVWVTAVAAMS